MTHLDGIGPAYTFLKPDEQANLAVIMQLSQVRPMSTIFGAVQIAGFQCSLLGTGMEFPRISAFWL
jgi:hypothetical protein